MVTPSPTTHNFEVITIETPTLGDRSYLVAFDGWALAVDVQRDLDRVHAILDQRNLRLGAVVETHIHNDYISGGLALSRRTGATYVVPAGPRLGFSATRAEDSTLLQVGDLEVRAIATPGHTDAHAAYSVSLPGEPGFAAFTGGSLLLGGTGRTDLLGPELAHSLAQRQYWSVRRLARLLPGDTALYPTHGFGSFCAAGTPTGGAPTLMAQMDLNMAFHLTEEAFVEQSLSVLGPPPAYYSYMGPRNAGGPTAADLTPLQAPPPEQPIPTIVDVRPRAHYANAHIPGSVYASLDGALATWLGWVLPIDTPILLVADTELEVATAQRELARIGIDDIRGAWWGERLCTELSRGSISTLRVSGANLTQALASDHPPLVLDVRESIERAKGYLDGTVHCPVHELDDLDISTIGNRQVWVHCAAGYRAGLAVSILESRGVRATWVDDTIEFPLRSTHEAVAAIPT